MRTHARFPSVALSDGHYESFYVKATRPGGGQGIWLRHTVHKPPGTEPSAALWLTLFDAERPGPAALKASYPPESLGAPAGAYIEIGEARLEPGRAAGGLSDERGSASWDLSFTDPGGALRHLPYDFLYRAPLPRTKLLTPYPRARFEGTVQLDGTTLQLDGWPGMIGHNWGAEHAERWVWIHGPALGVDGDGYLDLAAGRVKVGPLTTPWVANGMLRLDGAEHRLGGLGAVRATQIDDSPTSCRFELPGEGATVRGTVSAPPERFVAWIYADPEGPEHNTLNCSISDLELEVSRDGDAQRLQVAGAAAYELGTREAGHGIPLQPYSDG